MEQAGALSSPRFANGELIFHINFKIVEKYFYQHLETLVRSTLTDFEKYWYDEGIMAYKILENGDLEWKRTLKKL